MTIYRATLTKQKQTGADALTRWSNVYHINAPDLATAMLNVGGLVTLEKALYPDNVEIVRWSLSDPAAPRTGTSATVSEAGNRSTGTVATQLPLFNTVMLSLLHTGGRPSVMHFRLPLDESEVEDQKITTTLYDTLNTNFGAPLLALSWLTDESGNIYSDYRFDLVVHSRQLGWHRRTRAGYHRGWVPD